MWRGDRINKFQNREMNKEELHKAAEEWAQEKEKTGEYDHLTDTLSFVGVILTDFHLHQTKKMLEAWTGKMIEKEAKLLGIKPQEVSYFIYGCVFLRNKLLKQLEQ